MNFNLHDVKFCFHTVTKYSKNWCLHILNNSTPDKNWSKHPGAIIRGNTVFVSTKQKLICFTTRFVIYSKWEKSLVIIWHRNGISKLWKWINGNEIHLSFNYYHLKIKILKLFFTRYSKGGWWCNLLGLFWICSQFCVLVEYNIVFQSINVPHRGVRKTWSWVE